MARPSKQQAPLTEAEGDEEESAHELRQTAGQELLLAVALREGHEQVLEVRHGALVAGRSVGAVCFRKGCA